MKAGSYVTLSIENGIVEKTINIDKMTYAQRAFLNHCFAGKFDYNVLKEYYDLLKNSKINVVETSIEVSNNEIKMKQPVLDGLSLDYFIKDRSINFKREDFLECLEFLKRVAKIFVESHKFQSFYVDCNLMNFIINGNDLTLVDVFPPLIKNNLKEVNYSNVQQQVDLFVNPEIQFISMISYFLRPFYEDIDNKFLSESEKKRLSHILITDLLRELKPITESLFNLDDVVNKINENSQHIFQKRFYEIKKYFKSNNMSFEEFNNNFSSYSLKRVLDSLKDNSHYYECCLHQDIVDINIKTYDKNLLNDLFYYFKDNAQFFQKSGQPVFTIEIEKQSDKPKEILERCFKTRESLSEEVTYIDIDNKTKTIKIYLNENNKNNELVVRRNIYNIYARIMEESGYFTLHASCVEKNGKCYAIIGRKNAGKSVTMLNFLKKGYNLVSNDRLFIRSENNKLIAIGHPLSIGIRVTKKWFKDEQNKEIAQFISSSGFKFNFELGDSDKNKFYFTPKTLAELFKVRLKPISALSGIIVPSYEPTRDEFKRVSVEKKDIEELVIDQNIPAVHETKTFLKKIIIDEKIIKDSKKDIAKKLASLDAISISQNEKTTKTFFGFAEDLSK